MGGSESLTVICQYTYTGREVGVSRSAANNRSRGYKTYRHGKVVGFVAALDRLAVREISPRYLSRDECIEIADLRRAGLSVRQIAVTIGRAASTVSRELRRACQMLCVRSCV